MRKLMSLYVCVIVGSEMFTNHLLLECKEETNDFCLCHVLKGIILKVIVKLFRCCYLVFHCKWIKTPFIQLLFVEVFIDLGLRLLREPTKHKKNNLRISRDSAIPIVLKFS